MQNFQFYYSPEQVKRKKINLNGAIVKKLKPRYIDAQLENKGERLIVYSHLIS